MRTPSLLVETGFHQLASRFRLDKIRQRLLDASRRAEVFCRARVPWPNPLDTKLYLNRYEFHPNRPLVMRGGCVELAELDFVFSSIDLTFVRHLAAPFYRMRNWQPIHDPVNLYKIHLWITAEDLYHEEAIERLRHKRWGRDARELLDLKLEEVPKTYTVLTRFLERVGDEVLWKVSEVFFWILVEAGFFQAPEVFIAGDSQLVPSFSRFRGCNKFCGDCRRVKLTASQVQAALSETLDAIASKWGPSERDSCLESRHLVHVPCPSGATSGKRQRELDVRLGWLQLFEKRERPGHRDDAVTYHLQHPFLQTQGLGFQLEASALEPERSDGYQLRCPRLPSDISARIGWKNGNQPDDDPIPVFGAELEHLTFRMPELGLELPFGVLGGPGNGPKHLERLLEILDGVGPKVQPFAAAFDAGFDAIEHFRLLRQRHINPVIELVVHKGEDSPEATARRGISMQGVPLAQCGLPMKSNGFDYDERRRTFLCGHQNAPEICAQCPFGPHASKHGQVKSVSVEKYPRYVNEIPRGSDAYALAYAHRSAAERTHADVAEAAPKAIVRPRLRGVRKLAAKAGFAHQFILWRRVFNFIDDINHQNEVAGLYQSAVDDAVEFWGVGTLHALTSAQIEGCKPSHFG